MYYYVVGKNWLYAKTVTIELSTSHIACSDSIYSVHYSMCYIASIFHVLTRFGLQHFMLQTFQMTSNTTREKPSSSAGSRCINSAGTGATNKVM